MGRSVCRITVILTLPITLLIKNEWATNKRLSQQTQNRPTHQKRGKTCKDVNWESKVLRNLEKGIGWSGSLHQINFTITFKLNYVCNSSKLQDYGKWKIIKHLERLNYILKIKQILQLFTDMNWNYNSGF